jgi:hypothetical protein
MASIEVFKKEHFLKSPYIYTMSNSVDDSEASQCTYPELLVQHDTEQRTVHLQPAIVLNEAKLSESVFPRALAAPISAFAIMANLCGSHNCFLLELKRQSHCRTFRRPPRGPIGTNTVITTNSIGPSLRSIIRLSGPGSSEPMGARPFAGRGEG